jgi:hypothetical protein
MILQAILIHAKETLHSLQTDVIEADRQGLAENPQIRQLGDALQDFDNTVALERRTRQKNTGFARAQCRLALAERVSDHAS